MLLWKHFQENKTHMPWSEHDQALGEQPKAEQSYY